MVDQRRSFSNQAITGTMERLHIQLLLVLELNEPHGRASGRFRDRFGIAIIVLLGFDIGADVFGRHQPNFVPLRFQNASEVVGAAAGLHCHCAGRKTCTKLDDALPPHAPTKNDSTGLVQPNHATAVLSKIDSENYDFHRSTPSLNNSASMWHNAGASHSINFPRALNAHIGHLPKGKPIEIWFQDEARIGQKNGIVRLWAKRGTRPRQPADQRYQNVYLFGAICPAKGKGAGLAMPYADTFAMQLHLDEISRNVQRGAHAVLLLDRAGWHTTANLAVPKNMTMIFLPSRSPELNPVENVWHYLRQNWLSNQVFDTYDAIIDAACKAWQNLLEQPSTITSIGMREWAHTGQS